MLKNYYKTVTGIQRVLKLWKIRNLTHWSLEQKIVIFNPIPVGEGRNYPLMIFVINSKLPPVGSLR